MKEGKQVALVKGVGSLPKVHLFKQKEVLHSLQNPIVLGERRDRHGGENIYGSVAQAARPHEREKTTSSRTLITTHHERYKSIRL